MSVDGVEIPQHATSIPNVISDLKTLFKQNAQALMADLNCVTLGTIQSFDPATQSCTVSINYKRIFTNLPTPALMDYPLLVDVPVVVLSGGIGNLTFPIAAGDQCLVLFSDRDIDLWFAKGYTTSAPASQRMHSLADGFALVGVRNISNKLSGYNTAGVEANHGQSQLTLEDENEAHLLHGDSKLTLVHEEKAELKTTIDEVEAIVSAEEKVLISVDGATLKTALDALCTALTAWVDTSGDTPNPATVAAINAAKALIDGVLK